MPLRWRDIPSAAAAATAPSSQALHPRAQHKSSIDDDLPDTPPAPAHLWLSMMPVVRDSSAASHRTSGSSAATSSLLSSSSGTPTAADVSCAWVQHHRAGTQTQQAALQIGWLAPVQVASRQLVSFFPLAGMGNVRGCAHSIRSAPAACVAPAAAPANWPPAACPGCCAARRIAGKNRTACACPPNTAET